MTKNNLCLQTPSSDLDLITQQEFSTDLIQPLFITAATTSLVSIVIGIATTLSVIGRWYVKLIPLFRKLFPNTFKSDLDEWLENLVYQLILRDEDIRRETSPDELKTILKDTNTVVDLIELDPDELSDYLHTKTDCMETSPHPAVNDRSESPSEIEEEANLLARELEELHEVDIN